jgi:serine/threonine protein kinase/tetratricopeptide (TPR) repeat protein
MTPERWREVEQLYHAALEHSSGERATLLAGADPDMRGEVESLLAQADAGTKTLAAPIFVGTQIGSYRIEGRLGEGGMGTVYKAHDTKLNRPAAIKFLSDELADATARRRFQREAQMASSLNHPHIVTVYDAGEASGRQYLVTEYIDGGTLKDWAAREKRACRRIVELLAGVADGLATAHEARILHRDIKPANVLITTSGYAKLTDFGLAKLAEGVEAGDTRTHSEKQTQRGFVIGTIPYMSPEQVLGKQLDARSDIFSFGVMLYEVFSGHRPFVGTNDLEVMNKIVYGCAAPLEEGIPPALRTVVEKSLEKEPAERYQTMRDVVVDLRRLIRRDGEDTAPVAAVKGKRRWLGVAAAIVLLAGGVAVWRAQTSGPAQGPLRSLAVLPFQNLSGDASQEYFSDGTTEALISNLAQISALKVISRTSAMRYKATTKSLPEIGRELGVDAIIEGSVSRVGNRVRITAQLIRASTDTHLWARDYEREVADVLRLEADVSREIAQEIRVQVTPEEITRIASANRVNPEAQEEFLLGSYSRWKLRTADLKLAVQHFEKAIQLQPDFAAAYAGMSGALAELGTRDVVEQARAAARKALALDPQLSEAHSALARMSMTYDWDWASAEQGFRRALELNPNSLEYCQCYADLLAGMGRFPEAMAILERGAILNPVSSAIQGALGRVLVWGHDYKAAVPHLERAIELEPDNAVAYLFLGEAYEVSGDLTKALEATGQYLRLRGVELDRSPLTGRIYAKLGRRADAQRVLTNLTGSRTPPNARDMAAFYFALGDVDHGFESLTKAFDEHQDVLRVSVSGLFDGVRGDARFQALVKKLGIPAASVATAPRSNR